MSVQSPFYDWGNTSNYGATQDWRQTPLVTDYLDPQIPQGVYASYLGKHNLGGFDRQSQWAQSQYGRTQSGYQAALRVNPGLSYHDYLKQQLGGNAGGLRNDWLSLAPSARGEQPSLWSGGNTRTISWG